MATEKQRAAARKNVKKAQAGGSSGRRSKNLPKRTRRALGEEANKVRRGEEPTRRELGRAGAPGLDIRPLQDG